MTLPEVFQGFASATKDAFAYLVREYSYALTTEAAAGPEAWVVYEGGTTRVTVHYELGSAPWVEIGRLETRDARVVQPQSVGLDLVVRERGERFGDEVAVPRDLTEEELASMLKVRAEQLRRHASDLLRGDFSSFPKLQPKAEKELRRREAELFGSEE